VTDKFALSVEAGARLTMIASDASKKGGIEYPCKYMNITVTKGAECTIRVSKGAPYGTPDSALVLSKLS
jgi:hypothetical protein